MISVDQLLELQRLHREWIDAEVAVIDLQASRRFRRFDMVPLLQLAQQKHELLIKAADAALPDMIEEILALRGKPT